ncbi:MAG: phosphate ABC transporter substrate-binding protein PstS, partial [Acidimicrobiales bacterium]
MNYKLQRSVVPVLTLALAGAMIVGGVGSVASAAKVKHHKAPAHHKKAKHPVVSSVVKVETPPAGNITETGSTLLYPLWNIWAPAYQQQFPKVNITTGGTGSGTGIADAASGTVNIGSSDAYLSSSTLQATPSLLNIPLGISYQMITYNVQGVTAHLNLNGPVLAQIYQGSITNWDDPAIAALNPKVTLPNEKIVALHRSDGSGDTFIFSQYLSRTSASWRSAVGFGTTVSWPNIPNSLGEVGNGGMVTGCNATPGCIAYVGISFLSEVLNDGLTYAALKNGDGQYLLPNPTTAEAEAAAYQKQTPANGTMEMINGRVKGGYPIVNYEYAIV